MENITSKADNITTYTSTLITNAITYLLTAETIFGERTKEYTFAGIEFNETGPRIWFPRPKFVVIQLTPDTAVDFKRGVFQLSHEVVHLISPFGQPTTNNLEEGLATYFSKIITDRHTGDINYAINSISSSKYKHPFDLVTRLLGLNATAVIELRKVQPVIGQIVAEDFVKANLIVPDDLIKELVKPMIY